MKKRCLVLKVIMKALVFCVLFLIPSVLSTIQYPTQYPSTKYAYVFYQTSVSTTLAADITRDDKSISLTDASGFSTPGMLYFPDSGEIMHINSISGNTVTVNRDPRYTVGSGRFAHSAGETVVFAHFKYVTLDTAQQLFQDSAQPGDFVLFGTSYVYHFLESVFLNVSTAASYTSAEFEAFELNSLTSTSGDAEYYVHQFPVTFFDGTSGLKQSGLITFGTHESGLAYYYNDPVNFYNRVYDESGTSVLAFFVGLRLKNASGWTQGVNASADYYEKVFRPEGETGLTWCGLYQADKTTGLGLGENDLLYRQMVLYDDKKMPLDIEVSNYSASGSVSITGLVNDENIYAYFPFVEGTGFVVRDLRNYKDFLVFNGLNIPYGYGAEDRVYWVDGQFSGKKALHIQDNVYGVISQFDLCNGYKALGNKFSVEMVFRPNSSGTVFTIGLNDYYRYYSAYPFRFLIDTSGNLKAEVSTDAGNYWASYPITYGDWYYVTATYDGSTLRLYVNGSLVDSVSVSGTLEYSDPFYFVFGGYYDSSHVFSGDLSEIVIWDNRVLDSTEISDRNTKQASGYLQQINESISVSGDGVYTTVNDFSYVLSLSHTGTYDYSVSQPRFNIMQRIGTDYIVYTDFALKDSTFSDDTNAKVQVGTPWAYDYKAFNMDNIGTGSFVLGKVVNGVGYNGGSLILYNTLAQGTYRNYFRNTELYGVKVYISVGSVETRAGFKSLNSEYQSMKIGSNVYLAEGSYATVRKDTEYWHGNTFVNVRAYNYQYKPFYDESTLEVEPDEDTVVRTADETYAYVGNYYLGGFHKGVTVRNDKAGGYGVYFYHYRWKEVVVNLKVENGSFYVVSRSAPYDIHGSPTLGYTFKLRVVDENGNPVQGARVYLTDKDGYSAIFRPVGHPAQQYLYGSNYGGSATSLAVDDGTKYSVGDVLNLYGERVEVTGISGNTLTITRAVQNTGDAYAVRFTGTDADYSVAWIEKQQEYLETNAGGEIPELIIYTDYYKTSTDKITKNPLTLKVLKDGYEPLTLTFNLTEPMELVKELHGSRGLHPINLKMVSGTTYDAGDTVDVEVKVTDTYGGVVDNANCTFDIYYPNKSLWLDDIKTTNINGTGVYYNNSYLAPNVGGVYTYSATCTYGSYNTSDSKTFQVNEITYPNSVLTLGDPANGSWLNSIEVNFYFTPVSYYTINNCSLYTNESGSWNITKTITNVTNNSQNNITYLFSQAYSSIVWNVVCVDSNGNFTGSSNKTAHLDIVSPNVSLTNPYDGETVYSKTVTFNYTPSDDKGFGYCELWTNDSGSFSFTSNDSTITNGSDNSFTVTLNSSGYVLWNVKCVDKASNSNFYSSNYTIYISILNTTTSTTTVSEGASSGGGAITTSETVNETIVRVEEVKKNPMTALVALFMSKDKGIVFWVVVLVLMSVIIKSLVFRRNKSSFY